MLSCSIRLVNYFSPNWKQKKVFLEKIWTFCFGKCRMTNKTRTSKVGAISKAQKGKTFFGKKLEIFEKVSLSENVAQCRKM